jgi:hypothetical protein
VRPEEKFDKGGARFPAGSQLEPQFFEVVRMGDRQGWARGEGRWCGELIVPLLCVSVCRWA